MLRSIGENEGAIWVDASRGPVNVIGAGRSVWNDLAESPYPLAPSIGVNVGGVFAPRMLHWVSMHKEFFRWALPMQKYQRLSPTSNMLKIGNGPLEGDPVTHAWKKDAAGVDYVWFGEIVPDTSGCFAAMLAILFGFSPVVLCGVPLDDGGRFYDPHEVDRKGAYVETNDTWKWLRREHGGQIRSMSGRTREWFGRP